MAPPQVELPDGATFVDETDDEARERIRRRFEQIGHRLMNRTRGGADFQADPVAAVLHDPFKVRLAAEFLGRAFVIAYLFILHNKAAVEKIADEVLEKKEIYGDDLNRLLDSVKLKTPEIDWTKEETWPQI